MVKPKWLLPVWRMARIVKELPRNVRAMFRGQELRTTEAGRRGLLNLARTLPDGSVMVEIGSYRGESAEIFLSSGRVARIFCVDPWKRFYDLNDASAYTDMKEVELDFDRRHADDPRVVKVKGTIETFIERHGGEVIDFVYVDGCHTYQGAKNDILKARDCVRPRFAIGGHDWTWPGIGDAVRETLGEPDQVFEDTSWVKKLNTDK